MPKKKDAKSKKPMTREEIIEQTKSFSKTLADTREMDRKLAILDKATKARIKQKQERTKQSIAKRRANAKAKFDSDLKKKSDAERKRFAAQQAEVDSFISETDKFIADRDKRLAAEKKTIEKNKNIMKSFGKKKKK